MAFTASLGSASPCSARRQRSKTVEERCPRIGTASGKFFEKVLSADELMSTPATIRIPSCDAANDRPPRPQQISNTRMSPLLLKLVFSLILKPADAPLLPRDTSAKYTDS